MIVTKNGKKGFTLVELSIVIVLIAVVTAMCTTFLTTYYAQSNSQVGKRNVLDDLTRVQSVTKEWIAYYDNGENRIHVDSGMLRTLAESPKLCFDEETKKLVWDDPAAGIHKEYEMLSLTGIVFEAEMIPAPEGGLPQAKTVICRATYEELETTMLFTVFTGIQRSRYIDPARIDPAAQIG